MSDGVNVIKLLEDELIDFVKQGDFEKCKELTKNNFYNINILFYKACIFNQNIIADYYIKDIDEIRIVNHSL